MPHTFPTLINTVLCKYFYDYKARLGKVTNLVPGESIRLKY